MVPLSTKLSLIVALVFLISFSTWVGAEQVANSLVQEDVEDLPEPIEEEDLYVSPTINPEWVYFSEHFDNEQAFNKKWIRSEAKKQDVEETIAKYDGQWRIQAPSKKILKNDLGLVLTSEAKHAAISALLDRPFEFKDKPLVVQYEITLQDLLSCGGGYMKLLSKGTNTKADLRKFYDQTPYTIMFGPDKCGTSNKIHFIFKHVNPVNNSVEEKHCKKHTSPIDHIFTERSPHLLRLVVRPDNTYSVYLDQKEVNFGSLLEDFTPPVNPPEEIDDPNDKQPKDWDSREKIPDPLALKPEDWDETAPATIPDPNAVKPDGWLDDEPENIPDPNAVKPEDWDEDMDGEWEAPLIDNPKCTVGCGTWKQPTIANPNYKGPWSAPMIPNPDYKGQWTAKRIPNPFYFKDDHPFKMTPIHAIGFELWSMTPNILFDNIIVTDDESVADLWTEQTYALKKKSIIRNSKTLWGWVVNATNNNPGYWALYALYCSIPITAYIVFLVRRAREESFLDRMLHFTADHPWVYAVVIIVAFVFIAVWVYCCYNIKSDPEADEDAKKTDALLEDDPHLSDGEEEEAPELPRGKANLEEQPDSTQEADSEQPPAAAQAAFVDSDAAGDGQRKRKPRKE